MKFKLLAIAGLIALGLTGSSLAATPPAGGPDAKENARAQMASQLAAYGTQNKDPYALLAAVQAMRGLHAKIGVTGGTGTYDPVTLLKEAKTFAANDADLSKVIDGLIAKAGTGQGWYDAWGYYHCVYGWYYGYYGCW